MSDSKIKQAFTYGLPLLLFLLVARSLLVAMACGAVFAIACEPVCDFLARRLGKFAPAVTMLAAIVFVLTPIAFCISFGREDVAGFTEKMGDLGDSETVAGAAKQTTKIVNKMGIDIDQSMVDRQLRKAGASAGEWLMDVAKKSVAGTADAVLALFVLLMVFYAWLAKHKTIEQDAVSLLPLPDDQARRLMQAVRDASVDAVLGAGLVGLAQSVILLVFMIALGVPGAWLLAIICFFFSFLPVVGTLPVSLFATVYLFVDHEPVHAGIMLGGAGLVSVSDNLFRLVLKPKGNVPGLLNLVAILGGLELLGIGGLFIGPLVAAIADWSMRELLRQRQTVALIP